MGLIKWSPINMMEDVDHFVPLDWRSAISHVLTPAIDVYEDGENVIIEAPLTGIDPAKANIEIADNILKISGESHHTSEVDEKNYYRQEVRYGSFYRAVALPKAVQGERAEASYQDGILKIRIPKAEDAKPKKIMIKAN